MKKISTISFLIVFILLFPSQQTSVKSSATLDSKPINITPYTDAEISSYYTGVEGLDGNDLLTSLSDKIDDHVEFDYTTELKYIMKITDRDWNLSSLAPEKLANYSFSDLNDDDPYMYYMYGQYSGEISTAKRWSEDPTLFWNKEHIWAKSHGNFSTKKGAGTDLHHLRAADQSVNLGHSSLDFGVVGGTKTIIYDELGNPSGYTGSHASLGGKVFEPRDKDKGDVARAIFYMATRYDTFTDLYHPKLEILNAITDIGISWNATPTVNGTMGILNDLLTWNNDDPVDAFEIQRNNLIHRNFQGNRNPYIDHPEWAEMVYDPSYAGSGASNASESSSSGLTPAWDSFSTATLDYITIDTSEVMTNFALEDSFSSMGLTVYAHYDNETYRKINYYTTSISGGSPLLESGTINITVSHTHNGITKTATYPIQVAPIPKEIISIDLTTTDVKKTFNYGDYFDYENLVVTAQYDNDTTAGVSNFDIKIDGVSMLDEKALVPPPGTYDAVVTHTHRSQTVSASYQITISAIESATITLTSATMELTGLYTTNFSPFIESTYQRSFAYNQIRRVTERISGQAGTFYLYNENPLHHIESIVITHDGAPTNIKIYGGSSVAPKSPSNLVFGSANESVVTYNFSGSSSSYFYIDNDPSATTYIHSIVINYGYTRTLSHISVDTSEAQTTFALNSEFSTDGLQVSAHYGDGSTQHLYSFDVSTPNMMVLGQQTITVTALGKQTSYSITVTNENATVNDSSVALSYEHLFISGDISSGQTAAPYPSRELSNSVYGGSSLVWSYSFSSVASYYFTNNAKGVGLGKSDAPYTSVTLTSPSMNQVSKVVVNTSGAAGTNAKLAVSVGGSQLAQQSITATSADYTFDNPTTSSGVIVLNWTQTSSTAIYIKSVQIFTGGSTPESVTPTEQATAYANYFLSQTAPYCSTLDGDDAPWTSLAAEYGFMDDEAKDYFDTSSDAVIVQTRERYSFLINKYPTLAANNFMVDSKNQPIVQLSLQLQADVKDEKTLNGNVIVLLSFSVLFSVSIFIVLRKKDTINS